MNQGARLAGFIKRTTIICYTQTMKTLSLVVFYKKKFWALWFQRRRLFYVCSIVSLLELMTPGEEPFLTRGACLAGFM